MQEKIDIHSATKENLAQIELWLKNERLETGEGFYCNWSIIEAAYKKDELIVLTIDNQAVGFLTHTDYKIDILEIHPNHRKMGYGEALAQWAIDDHYSKNNSVIEIECKPEASIPFWQKMGFTVHATTEVIPRYIGYKVLNRPLSLPTGKPASFRICFYNQEAAYNEKIPPFKVYEGTGVINKALGYLALPERAICHNPKITGANDYVVSLNIEGEEIFKDKLKYSEATEFGILRGKDYTYYLDKVILNTQSSKRSL